MRLTVQPEQSGPLMAAKELRIRSGWLAALSFCAFACSETRVVQTALPPEVIEERWRSTESPEQIRQEMERSGSGFRVIADAWSETTGGAGDTGSAAAGALPAYDAGLGSMSNAQAAAGAFANTTAAAPQVDARSGGPGLGDPDFTDYGNSGYDVRHYDIRLRYTPSEDRLQGVTTVTLIPEINLLRFNFDFVLAVSEVTVDGVKADFARADQHELVIKPATPLLAGRSINVVVKYEDIPSRVRVAGLRRSAWWRTSDGAIGAGAPENAWWWFPSNDHPLDKATYDVSVTVPEGMTVVSNGVQPVPPTPVSPGWVNWTWHSSQPQQTYVALLAMGEYEIVESKTDAGLPLIYAYTKRYDTQNARAIVERTADIMTWQQSLFGPYPFEALGAVVSPDDGIAYANEAQTRPIYPVSFFGTRGDGGVSMVVHESAHQWFGDSAAVKQWRDIWMSEGCATYAEWLYSEAQGNGTAQEIFDAAYARYAPNDPYWQLTIGDPGKDQLYHSAVYSRGAMTFHQLRSVVGDDMFFAILRTWADTRRHSNGSTDEFRALAEAISGKPLEALFNSWLYTPGKPKAAAANTASAASAQSQNLTPPLPRSWASLMATERMHRPLPER